MKPNPSDLFSSAKWIWPVSQHWDIHNGYALFRKCIELTRVPRTAPLCITADQSYQLYVNGRYVCRGPARGFQRNWPYDEVDVRAFLRVGKNCIAVRAHTPGLSNFQYVHQGYAGLLVAARWGKIVFQSDASWKARRQRGVVADRVVTSLQLFPQEDIDLREEDPSWMEPGYDDSQWMDQIASSAWNAMPWPALEERGIPLLKEEIIAEGACIGRAEGKACPANPREARNIAIVRGREGLAHVRADGGDLAKPIRFAASGKGRWRSVLVDFGKTVVGSVRLEIAGAQGGEVVETFHAETIDPQKLEPHFLPEAHCRMAFAHRLTCRRGKQSHQFYHSFGFRYLVLTVRENPRPLSVKLSLRTTLYPHEIKGVFRSSEKSIEAIWETCAWTQQCCSLDAYVDTPWREQAQWWGDARVQAWNTFHLSGDDRLLRRGIRQIAQQRAPSGLTYGHAPTMAHGCILPDFTLIWICTVWDAWRQSGDLTVFLEQQKTIESTLDYFKEWTDPKSGLLRYDLRYWLFLDWTELQKDGQPSVYSLWLLYTLDRLQELYRAAKQPARARGVQQWSRRLREALRRLLTPQGLLSDGILPNGRRNPHCSVHAQTLSLMTRLAPEHTGAMLQKSLLPFVREQSHSAVRPSSYWVTYVYTVLAESGHGAEVVSHIRRHWAPMVAHGTTWENWESKPGDWSHSHAWSAHPLFHLMQILGGIRSLAPGWTHVAYAPAFIGDSAEVLVPTPLGEIQSRWERAENTVQATLVIPEGMRAKATLPGQPARSVGAGTHRFRVVLT